MLFTLGPYFLLLHALLKSARMLSDEPADGSKTNKTTGDPAIARKVRLAGYSALLFTMVAGFFAGGFPSCNDPCPEDCPFSVGFNHHAWFHVLSKPIPVLMAVGVGWVAEGGVLEVVGGGGDDGGSEAQKTGAAVVVEQVVVEKDGEGGKKQ